MLHIFRIFTVSILGIYLFSWAVTACKLHGETACDVWAMMVANVQTTVGAAVESRYGGDDNQGSNTTILRIKQGDQVWLSHLNEYPYTSVWNE